MSGGEDASARCIRRRKHAAAMQAARHTRGGARKRRSSSARRRARRCGRRRYHDGGGRLVAGQRQRARLLWKGARALVLGVAFEAIRHAFALAEQWAARCVMRVRQRVRRRHDRQHADRHHTASSTPFDGARPGVSQDDCHAGRRRAPTPRR